MNRNEIDSFLWDVFLKGYAEKRKVFLGRAKHIFAIMFRDDLFPIDKHEEIEYIWLDIEAKTICVRTEEFFGGGSERYYYDFPMKLMSLGDDEIIEYFQELKKEENKK